MLPTPSTSHVAFDRVYEPAEDSFLLLDTLSAPHEARFLAERFRGRPAPLVVEVGSGSGVVLAFVARNADTILRRSDALALAVDISAFACRATAQTAATALADAAPRASLFLDAVNADLATALRPGSVDILIFNPPYVPTPALPDLSKHAQHNVYSQTTTFDQDSYLLELSYAGGQDGMETTDRLLAQLHEVLHPERGVAYILLCAQNKPLDVQRRVRGWGAAWAADLVGSSGKQAGWEKLQILRVARVQPEQ
ncbi:DNA methylase N-6 adenine-specific conserved site [Neofusicoccum parvum]|uniref:DNA methylase N-6 adenine-specific conserved site n=2 Tax=Neofusicoccum parvum TaxID=310453 RepID=A0ACB5SDH8_9PEZI|nr:putative n -glutamine methyltransferase mtq2 protein [Neofusicoccum parvum UCRNP2]GME35362.1 DNA methylase N-6 adenine-specific conserved site [Neofusicoccum parvum]GME35788.1 DNA methylase N-6 adenine-specific conserved site [Neofusicoccum parvum]